MFVAIAIGALLMQAGAPSLTLAAAPADTARPAPISVADSTSRPASDSTWLLGAPIDARLVPHWDAAPSDVAPVDTNPRRRPRAIEYSDWYYRRLVIHKWGSYLELPIFAAEYYLGQRLLTGPFPVPSWYRPAHIGTAVALSGLFGINTVTGLWNLWDSRQSTDQRALIWTHSALMLASDAGFVAATAIAGPARRGGPEARRHKNVAVASFGVATLGTVIMWFGRH